MANKRSSPRSRGPGQFRTEVSSFLADLDEFAGQLSAPAATEPEVAPLHHRAQAAPPSSPEQAGDEATAGAEPDVTGAAGVTHEQQHEPRPVAGGWPSPAAEPTSVPVAASLDSSAAAPSPSPAVDVDEKRADILHLRWPTDNAPASSGSPGLGDALAGDAQATSHPATAFEVATGPEAEPQTADPEARAGAHEAEVPTIDVEAPAMPLESRPAADVVEFESGEGRRPSEASDNQSRDEVEASPMTVSPDQAVAAGSVAVGEGTAPASPQPPPPPTGPRNEPAGAAPHQPVAPAASEPGPVTPITPRPGPGSTGELPPATDLRVVQSQAAGSAPSTTREPRRPPRWTPFPVNGPVAAPREAAVAGQQSPYPTSVSAAAEPGRASTSASPGVAPARPAAAAPASGRPWTLAAAMEPLPPLAPPPARPSVPTHTEANGRIAGVQRRSPDGVSPWVYICLALLIGGVLVVLLVTGLHHR